LTLYQQHGPAKLPDTMEDLRFKAAHNRERDRNPIEFAFVERMGTFPHHAYDDTQPAKNTEKFDGK